MLDQRGAAVNVLALTAAALVVADPIVVFDAGFWLTTAATAGLVLGLPRPAAARVAPARLDAGAAAHLGLGGSGPPANRGQRVPAGDARRRRALGAGDSCHGRRAAGGARRGRRRRGGACAPARIAASCCAWRPRPSPSRRGWSMPCPGCRGGCRRPLATAVVALRDCAGRVAMGAPAGGRHGRRGRPPARDARGGAGLAAWMAVSPATLVPSAPGELRVAVLDVGQGDAMLVHFPNGRRMLVDAGGASGDGRDLGTRVVGPTLRARGIRRLDYLVVTHADIDHIGGAATLVREFRPAEVWAGVPVADDAATARLREVADAIGAGWRQVVGGDRLDVGAVQLEVLHPPLPDWERQRVRNDDSIVLAVRLGAVRVVLPGDIGAAVEAELAPRGRRRARVSARHHGAEGGASRQRRGLERAVARRHPAVDCHRQCRGRQPVRTSRRRGAGPARAASAPTCGAPTAMARSWFGPMAGPSRCGPTPAVAAWWRFSRDSPCSRAGSGCRRDPRSRLLACPCGSRP